MQKTQSNEQDEEHGKEQPKMKTPKRPNKLKGWLRFMRWHR